MPWTSAVLAMPMCESFIELGFLKDVPGVYTLPFDEIRKLDGFGEKSITKLQAAIEASKMQPLHRVIYALGIRYVGETTAKTLAKAVITLTILLIIPRSNCSNWKM